MNWLISLRNGLGSFLTQHDTVFRGLLKFLIAFAAFQSINLMLGQTVVVNHLFVVLVLAGICTFLPTSSILLIGFVMALLHFYGISLEAALAGGGMLVVLLLLYFSFAPKTAFPLLLGAAAAGTGFPCASAVLLGLFAGPGAAIGVGFGILVYYLIRMVGQFGGSLEATSADAADALMEKMISLISMILANREMLFTAVICVIVTWIVMMLRRTPLSIGWILASAAGMITYVIGKAAGQILLGVNMNWLHIGTEVLLGMLLAVLAQLFLFNLEFRKTENVQFEDDEYYYYVKAVPKKKVEPRTSAGRSERR